jgi:membrane-associated protease RseP (regulator of RpoE activity)
MPCQLPACPDIPRVLRSAAEADRNAVQTPLVTYPVPRPARRFPTVNVLLFAATVVTTLLVGAVLSPAVERVHSGDDLLTHGPELLREGLRFSASILGILLVHEMAHYLLARRHGVDASLPYFIPVPFGIGTLGAIIRMRSRIPSRAAALDIGASGPIAGFAVAIPLLLWGLAHSEVRAAGEALAQAPVAPAPAAMLWRVLHGEPALPAASAFTTFGDSLALQAAQFLALGPLPAGSEVIIHPVGFAAWVGLLVTALNLLPIGQLDGGHVAYALLGPRRAVAAGRLASFGLLAAGFFLSWSWLVWWALTRFVVGFGHPPARDEGPLGGGRVLLALLALAVLVVTFVPVPVSM